MTIIYSAVGEIAEVEVGNLWVVIFGGVTRAGNRRARRAVEMACRSDLDVVWFDGFEEREVESGARVPIPGSDTSKSTVRVVEYVSAENSTLAGRLRLGDFTRANPLARVIWRLIARRTGQILRPRSCWQVVRDDVRRLGILQAPEAIVYGDDHAITSAWRAGRAWPDSPIVRNLANR